mgnify:CR=1 FL=1
MYQLLQVVGLPPVSPIMTVFSVPVRTTCLQIAELDRERQTSELKEKALQKQVG